MKFNLPFKNIICIYIYVLRD